MPFKPPETSQKSRTHTSQSSRGNNSHRKTDGKDEIIMPTNKILAAVDQASSIVDTDKRTAYFADTMSPSLQDSQPQILMTSPNMNETQKSVNMIKEEYEDAFDPPIAEHYNMTRNDKRHDTEVFKNEKSL